MTAPTLATLEKRLADLRAELAGLPAQADAAKRSGDVEGWLALDLRGDDLPAEIAAAEANVWAAQADSAWARAGELYGTLVPLREAAAASSVSLRALEDAAPSINDAVFRTRQRADQAAMTEALEVQGRHNVDLAQAQFDRSAAEAACADALDATCQALFEAETLDARLAEAGHAPTAERTEPADLLALPVTLTDTTVPKVDKWGALSHQVSTAVRCKAGPLGSVILLKGTVLPRWVALRLHDGNPSLFSSPDEKAAMHRAAQRPNPEAGQGLFHPRAVASREAQRPTGPRIPRRAR